MPALRRDHDPQGLQAPRGGGLPDRRGEQACGEGEVDSARASVDATSVVGAAAVGGVTGFERLANALWALYPKDSEEKRLLGAMLLAVPR
jgi:hypothetical protein